MELISKISKGSKMDQIYIPKKREGLTTGSYVIIKPIESSTPKINPYFYNIKSIEPIKLQIINQIIRIINKTTRNNNIIITGSFLDKGFNFNDIDILLLNENKLNLGPLKQEIKQTLGIIPHIISINNKTLIQGLSTDPLYQMMLSQYISKKRFIYNIKPKINYKILDLHLLKSKLLINNFNILTGSEKYYLIRNLIAINLFLKNKKINNEKINNKIKQLFNVNTEKIKQNLLEKNSFLKKFRALYDQTFNKIMKGIQDDSK